MKPLTFSTSDTGAMKEDKLARFDLIPAGPLWDLALVYGMGAEKYDDRNWEKGFAWSKPYAAIGRHASAFWQGETFDREFGTCHMVHVAWNAFALAEFVATHPGLDDRPIGSASTWKRP